MQMDVKPNLYANLDIISVVGTNGSKPWSNHTQNGLLQHPISSNGPKWSETVQKYRKWVKISNGMEFLNFLLFIQFF